jgi:hypothetical protein
VRTWTSTDIIQGGEPSGNHLEIGCQNRWLAELRQVGLSAWNTKKTLRHSQSYGSMKSGKPEDRLRDILPFVRAITDHVDLAVAVDVAE